MRQPNKDWSEEHAREVIARHVREPGGLIPALEAVQNAFGFIPKQAIALIADAFNVTRAEVFGVASFYHDFRLEGPAGRHVLKLCRAEACQATGADALAQTVKSRMKIEWHETTADGEWTLEPVFCLGLCALGPCAMIDGEPVARLDDAKLRTALDEASK